MQILLFILVMFALLFVSLSLLTVPGLKDTKKVKAEAPNLSHNCIYNPF